MTATAADFKVDNRSVPELFSDIARSFPRKRAKLACLAASMPSLGAKEEGADVGTGNGSLAYHLHRRGEWTFIDADAASLRTASRLVAGSFHAGDAVEFLRRPKNKSRFHVITGIDVIFYFDPYEPLLAAIAQALRPGGKVMLSGMNRPRGILGMLRVRLGIEKSVGAKREISAAELERAMSAVGLRLRRKDYYFGPCAQALQTAIDFMLISRKGGTPMLIPPIEKETSFPLLKRAALHLLRGLCFTSEVVDAFLPWAHRHAYVLVAERAGNSR